MNTRQQQITFLLLAQLAMCAAAPSAIAAGNAGKGMCSTKVGHRSKSCLPKTFHKLFFGRIDHSSVILRLSCRNGRFLSGTYDYGPSKPMIVGSPHFLDLSGNLADNRTFALTETVNAPVPGEGESEKNIGVLKGIISSTSLPNEQLKLDGMRTEFDSKCTLPFHLVEGGQVSRLQLKEIHIKNTQKGYEFNALYPQIVGSANARDRILEVDPIVWSTD